MGRTQHTCSPGTKFGTGHTRFKTEGAKLAQRSEGQLLLVERWCFAGNLSGRRISYLRERQVGLPVIKYV